jgi:hypothetical protein
MKRLGAELDSQVFKTGLIEVEQIHFV